MNSLKQQHRLFVKSAKPPIVEFDVQCGAIYVRFSDRKVAETFERSSDRMVVTIDVDKSGEVIGVEGLGFNEFTLSGLLKKADVRAENIDFSKAKFRATPVAVSRALAHA